MKKIAIGIFSLSLLVLLYVPTTNCFASAKEFENISFELKTEDGKIVQFDKDQICTDKTKQNKFNTTEDFEILNQNAQKIAKMGFSNSQIVQFLFPGIEQVFDGIENKVDKTQKNAELFFDKTNASFEIEPEIVGKKFLKEETAKNILEKLKNSNKIVANLEIETTVPEISGNFLKQFCNKKATFSTWCGSSSGERKHNIKTACNAISGTKIESGKTFSFNNTTGARTKDAGYKQAKIITNGSYTKGFGGGVCQVSTTLYNAALLAGLEITEVHQHSLPVSYVEPSRDAMVSGSSADLKIKNSTNGPIFIKADLVNDEKIVISIYGQKNEYNYYIQSVTKEIIPKGEDEVVFTNKIDDEILTDGEERRVSHAKDGIVSEAFLTATDKSGKIVYTKKIRNNRYNPTKGIVAKRKAS